MTQAAENPLVQAHSFLCKIEGLKNFEVMGGSLFFENHCKFELILANERLVLLRNGERIMSCFAFRPQDVERFFKPVNA